MLAPGVRILATLLVATAAGACTAAQPPAASPTAAPAPGVSASASASVSEPGAPAARDPLRVVYVTLNGAMGPLWVAKEAGIFAKNGIDAEMVYISSGTLGMQALLAKEVDIGVIAASAAIAANLSGADTIYIGAIQRTFGLWVYANPDVETPAELRDKRVGITRRGSTTEVGLGYYLDKFGLAPDRDLAVVEIGDQAAMVPALKNGSIHAAVLSDPATFTAKREGFRELADLTQLGVEYPQSALTTTRGFATERRDLVERFMRSVYEGTHRYKTDRALGLEVLGKYFQTSDPELLASAYDLYVGRLVQDAPRANLEGTRTVLAELAATNEQARGADPARFLDQSFVEALDRQGLERQLYGR